MNVREQRTGRMIAAPTAGPIHPAVGGTGFSPFSCNPSAGRVTQGA